MTHKINAPFRLPPLIGWLLPIERLKRFYDILIKRQLIPQHLRYEDFASHYILLWIQPQRIQWLYSNQLLVEIHFALMDDYYIIPTSKRLSSKISHHFLDKNGRTLKPNCLHQCHSRLKGNVPLATTEAIVRELLNNN